MNPVIVEVKFTESLTRFCIQDTDAGTALCADRQWKDAGCVPLRKILFFKTHEEAFETQQKYRPAQVKPYDFVPVVDPDPDDPYKD
jgi:hypothetical protein